MQEKKSAKKIIIIIAIGILLLLGIGIVIGIVNAVGIYSFLFSPVEIAGHSMEPNFINGEKYIVNVIGYKFSTPQRGDVVVYISENEIKASVNVRHIGRIIAMPGEKIQISSGKVFVDGEELSESYLLDNTTTEAGSQNQQQGMIIPGGEYFIMGDNRSSSYDSRNMGSFERDEIIGKIWFCYAGCK